MVRMAGELLPVLIVEYLQPYVATLHTKCEDQDRMQLENSAIAIFTFSKYAFVIFVTDTSIRVNIYDNFALPHRVRERFGRSSLVTNHRDEIDVQMNTDQISSLMYLAR